MLDTPSNVTEALTDGIINIIAHLRARVVDVKYHELERSYTPKATLSEFRTVTISLPRRTCNTEIAMRALGTYLFISSSANRSYGALLLVNHASDVACIDSRLAKRGALERVTTLSAFKDYVKEHHLPQVLISDSVYPDKELRDILEGLYPWPEGFIWVRLGTQQT